MTSTTTLVKTNTRRRRRSTHGAGHEADVSPLAATMDHDATVASHRHYYSPFSGSARYSRPSFSAQSGWGEGFDGKLTYVGRGGPIIAEASNDELEEEDNDLDDHQYDIYDDDDDEHDNNEGNNDADNYYSYDVTHSNKNTTRLPSLSEKKGPGRRNTFGIPISPPTSPPPPPQRLCPPDQNRALPPQQSPLLSSSSPLQIEKHLAPTARTQMRPAVPPSGRSTLPQSQPSLNPVTEIALLENNSTLLRTVIEDLRILCTVSLSRFQHVLVSNLQRVI